MEETAVKRKWWEIK